MQLTSVNALPRISGLVLLVIMVENRGESAITNIPQINIKDKNIKGESMININGSKRQHTPESDNEIEAICSILKIDVSHPARLQDNPPIAIIMKLHNGILNSVRL